MTALLQARDLAKRYGGINAVDGVDLDIAANEVICIIGPNGAGKSSLLSLLGGTAQPTAGAVHVAGRAMAERPVHDFARAGIVRKFQGTNVFPALTVRQNLEVAGLAIASAALRPAPDIDGILGLIKLRPQAELAAAAISHGQRQWLEVGMALMCRPALLLLDEPSAGMTTEGTAELAALVRRLQADMAVLVIEHDMAFVRAVGCRTIVMHQGRIIADGDFDTVADQPLVRDAYLGRA